MAGATSWNSELPSGRNPFWIKDEALAELGLHAGQAVGVDTQAEPADGELVLAEVETDELADRLVRRYRLETGTGLTILSAPGAADLRLTPEQVLVLGVIRSRVRFARAADGIPRVVEEPL